MRFEKEEGRVRMRIGSARVSTEDQSLDLQHDAWNKAGCKRVVTSRISTTKAFHCSLDVGSRHPGSWLAGSYGGPRR
jgi:hypothetical protein